MPLRTVNGLQPRVGDVGRQLLLLGEREQPVRHDAQDQSGLPDLAERLGDGGGAAARDVVRVELARHGDVTVRVEALDELGALVTEVGLRGEIGAAGLGEGEGLAAGQGGGPVRGAVGAVELGIG